MKLELSDLSNFELNKLEASIVGEKRKRLLVEVSSLASSLYTALLVVKEERKASDKKPNESRNKTLDFSKLGFTTEQMTEMTTGSKTKKQLKKENKLLAKELMIANDDFHKVVNELNVLKLKIKELNK